MDTSIFFSSHQHVNFMLNDTILVINMNQMDTSVSFLSKIKTGKKELDIYLCHVSTSQFLIIIII